MQAEITNWHVVAGDAWGVYRSLLFFIESGKKRVDLRKYNRAPIGFQVGGNAYGNKKSRDGARIITSPVIKLHNKNGILRVTTRHGSTYQLRMDKRSSETANAMEQCSEMIRTDNSVVNFLEHKKHII